MLQQVCYTYFVLTKKLQTCYFINLDTKDTLTCEHINNKHNDLLYLDEKQKSQSKMGKFPLGKMDHNSNIVQVHVKLAYLYFLIDTYSWQLSCNRVATNSYWFGFRKSKLK